MPPSMTCSASYPPLAGMANVYTRAHKSAGNKAMPAAVRNALRTCGDTADHGTRSSNRAFVSSGYRRRTNLIATEKDTAKIPPSTREKDMKVIVRFSGLSGAAVALLMVGLIVVAGGLGP